jgi:hypothetical protein
MASGQLTTHAADFSVFTISRYFGPPYLKGCCAWTPTVRGLGTADTMPVVLCLAFVHYSLILHAQQSQSRQRSQDDATGLESVPFAGFAGAQSCRLGTPLTASTCPGEFSKILPSATPRLDRPPSDCAGGLKARMVRLDLVVPKLLYPLVELDRF